VRRPWVIVAGDFVRTGGMDAANHALASYLARMGTETHLVAHRIADDLAELPTLHLHAVSRPLRSHTLGFPLLDRAGRRAARELAPRDPVVLGNGGNCRAANGCTTSMRRIRRRSRGGRCAAWPRGPRTPRPCATSARWCWRPAP
jgi:hypothetical protein